MIRFPGGDDDKVLPEEQRFYYLRLMAKPSEDKREPIKTKFVRWAPPCPQQNSVETDQDLESQAMRVVRTIGQAFEVCHKVTQEQVQGKLQEDSESGSNLRVKDWKIKDAQKMLSNSLLINVLDDVQRPLKISEKRGCVKKQKNRSNRHPTQFQGRLKMNSSGSIKEGIDEDSKKRHQIRRTKRDRHKLFYIGGKKDILIGSVISIESDHCEKEEKLAKVSEASHTPSPTDIPPPPAPNTPAYLQKRHSLFMPQKIPETPVTSGATVEIATSSTAPTFKDCVQSNAAGEQQKLLSAPVAPIPQNNMMSGNPTVSVSNPAQSVCGSSTLPYPMNWGPQMTAGHFQSMQSLDQRGLSTIPFYPMPIVGPSASLPYGLSSPYLLSPYATMQLPRNTSEQQVPTPNPNIPGSPPDGQDLTAYQLSLSLDQYNQHLIRSQLDQAQQTAQVASCQVQLLRDQLTSETTARIEAQSRTHQLLNANRELLEQVQALVQRLQSLEARLTEEIQDHITQPSTSKGHSSSGTLPAVKKTVAPEVSTAARSFHEHCVGEAKVPGPPPIDPSKPYQLQSLADIRAGSLPPQGAETRDSSSVKKHYAIDDSGIRTEPESGAEDTTDYSSSDQYEKVLPQKSVQQLPVPQSSSGSQLNILVSNPHVMTNLSSFFSGQSNPSNVYPHYLAHTSRNQNSESNKLSEEQSNISSSIRRSKDKSAVLGGETMFNRMSFNPKLWEGKRKDTLETKDSSMMESIEEGQGQAEQSNSDEKQKIEEDISRKRNEKLERYRIPFVEETGASTAEKGRGELEKLGKVERLGKLALLRQKSVSSERITLEPASLHIATAMYPPGRLRTPMRSGISKVESLRKMTLPPTLSLDICDSCTPTPKKQQQPALQMSNGPITPSTSLVNHIGVFNEGEESSPGKLGTDDLNQVLILQETLKHGLTCNRQQLRNTSETLDRLSPQRYMESKEKLGDSAVLAKLTKLSDFKSAHSPLEKTESSSVDNTSPKSAVFQSFPAKQSETASKNDSGNV